MATEAGRRPPRPLPATSCQANEHGHRVGQVGPIGLASVGSPSPFSLPSHTHAHTHTHSQPLHTRWRHASQTHTSDLRTHLKVTGPHKHTSHQSHTHTKFTRAHMHARIHSHVTYTQMSTRTPTRSLTIFTHAQSLSAFCRRLGKARGLAPLAARPLKRHSGGHSENKGARKRRVWPPSSVQLWGLMAPPGGAMTS